MLIIDAHCHYGTGAGLTGPWDTSASLIQYEKRAWAAGIKRSIIFAPLGGDYSRGNKEVAQKVRSNPKRYWGFIFINPVSNKGKVYPIVQLAVEKWRFKGIKVHRSDGRISREVCQAAHRFNIPILYDVMGEVEVVPLLAKEFPGVNFIIPHLGSFADNWKAQLHFIPFLSQYPNIYSDSSGVKRFDLLEKAVEQAGASKLIFGTDGPWLHPAVELSKIYALKLPLHEQKQVLGGNIVKLLPKESRKSIPSSYMDRVTREYSGS